MKIGDLHNDIITAKTFKKAKKYLTKNLKYLNKIVLAVWTTHTKYNNFLDIELLIKNYQALNFPNVLFGIEDISVIREQDYVKIPNFNFFYASLTWNYDNELGGGAYGNLGLTLKGKNLLKILQENKVVLDTAHQNQRTFWDCIENFDGNIINSHTCFDSVFKHKRNIADQQINAIIQKGGIIGLSLVGDFLSGEKKPKIEDVIRHIDYFVQKFGDHNLCIGTDFFGTDNLPKNLNSYPALSILVEKLQKIGYNKNTIERIFYINFDNFLRLI
jgi:membrane dipeptidase